MSYNWGPHYIVPSEALKSYSGRVKLRENLDDDLLRTQLKEMGLEGPIVKIVNPWYFRPKNTDTWIKIGESEDRSENFAVSWDTQKLKNGAYEILGLMHVFVRKGTDEIAIARENTVVVKVKN
ncbi:MAG: hypothetical protein Q8O43_03775 [Dehalococcoidia bacterium]|nr:hypothetical protein [Dehalococcoidia bacterium]